MRMKSRWVGHAVCAVCVCVCVADTRHSSKTYRVLVRKREGRRKP